MYTTRFYPSLYYRFFQPQRRHYSWAAKRFGDSDDEEEEDEEEGGL
jgi:hypothetical protein